MHEIMEEVYQRMTASDTKAKENMSPPPGFYLGDDDEWHPIISEEQPPHPHVVYCYERAYRWDVKCGKLLFHSIRPPYSWEISSFNDFPDEQADLIARCKAKAGVK